MHCLANPSLSLYFRICPEVEWRVQLFECHLWQSVWTWCKNSVSLFLLLKSSQKIQHWSTVLNKLEQYWIYCQLIKMYSTIIVAYSHTYISEKNNPVFIVFKLWGIRSGILTFSHCVYFSCWLSFLFKTEINK